MTHSGVIVRLGYLLPRGSGGTSRKLLGSQVIKLPTASSGSQYTKKGVSIVKEIQKQTTDLSTRDFS
jgi:hypothetical protein